MTEPIKKLIATYARVSTANQEEEQTIKNQLLTMREFAEKNGYKIVKEYTDDAWSGDVLDRPALDELRLNAKEKARAWEAILIYDPDRLARRYSYQALVMDELQEKGIEVLFVTTPPARNSEDKLMYGVKGVFAEYERIKIAERFRLGKLRKVREGHILTTKPLYGYSYIPKQGKVHGYYEINEDEARVVRMIFGWVGEEAYTLRQIVRKLQELKIKPRQSKRGVWSTSTLSTMLKHRGYIGEAHWGSSYAVVPENPTNKAKYRKVKKSSRRIKPREEWIESKIPIPPIIEIGLFEKTQKQLKENFALCQRNRRNEYLLANKIFCACGRTRAGEGPLRGKYLYYRCTDRVSSYPLPHQCQERGINARIADKLVWQKVTGLMNAPELMVKQIGRWTDDKQTKVKSSPNDAIMIESEIKKLKEQEDRYSKAYGAGLYSVEQLKEYIDPIRERIAVMENQVKEVREAEQHISVKILPSAAEVQIFTRNTTKAIHNHLNFAEKRAIMLDILTKVIGTQQKLQVFGYIPLSLNVKLYAEDRNRGTTQCGQVYIIQRLNP